jgi:hypothetical protein
VRFSDGEVVRWHKVTTTINNLIIGKLYVDHYGTMKLKSSEGLLAKAKFKEQSFMEKNPHQVRQQALAVVRDCAPSARFSTGEDGPGLGFPCPLFGL